ncbi:MAG: hypothetical protein JNK05_23535 [Myxococcales bacterium]|nr:hypothetical protein [Myxococcales bacterium]
MLVHVVGSVVTTQRIATASIVAFASSGPDDGWIAGANRELFRWDGSNFVRFAVPVPSSVTLDGLTFAIRSLSGVWSLGPNDLFVSSSEFEPEPLLLQLVGNRWVPSRWASGRARVVALARQDGDLIVLAGGSVWRRRVGMNEHEQAASGSISGMVQLRDGRILLSESWWISVLRRADAAMTGAEGISGSTLTSTGYTSYRLQHASASGSAWLLTDNSGHVVRVNF